MLHTTEGTTRNLLSHLYSIVIGMGLGLLYYRYQFYCTAQDGLCLKALAIFIATLECDIKGITLARNYVQA